METLEEAAERLYSGVDRQVDRMLFINGAKWQQEQNKNKYSEEEVYNLLCKLPNYFKMTIPQQAKARKEWFEQFKK